MHAPVAWWTPLRPWAQRWLACYLALFTLHALAGTGLAGAALDLLHAPYVLVGKFVFGVELTVFTNGSGDTTYDWIVLAVNLVASLSAATIWSFVARGTASTPRLADALSMWLRFLLANFMLLYGFAKVFGQQMPPPSLERLSQPLGSLSPMSLLWSFMGASPAYESATGLVEVLAGSLLFFRRTQFAGALLCAGVMGNVWLLNMCYDVPVKIFSFHLLAFAGLVALPDARRAAAILLRDKAVEARSVEGPWSVRTRRILAGARIAWLLTAVPAMAYISLPFDSTSSSNPLVGPLWAVAEARVGGVASPAHVDNLERWQLARFEEADALYLLPFTIGGGLGRIWRLEAVDAGSSKDAFPAEGRWRVKALVEGTEDAALPSAGELEYKLRDGQLSLSGELDIDGRRERHEYLFKPGTRRREDFRLVGRGFHWINERPYSR